jgi:Fur family transcriptional regulator, peroxide stress response regulator
MTPQIEQRMQSFQAACRDAGVKLTHQRLEIFREVAARSDHPDAEEVCRGVQRRVPTVSLDTVYRTLWLLTDLGLLSTLGPRRESVRFDANTRPHHHYVCVRCGMTRDLEGSDAQPLGIPEGAHALGSVTQAYLELRGTCARCLAAGDAARTPAHRSRTPTDRSGS